MAILLTLVALFIPAFDSFNKRQAPLNNAQIISEGLARAKSYALAPPVTTHSESANHRFIVLKLAFSTVKVESYYQILTAAADEDGLPDKNPYNYISLQSKVFLPAREVGMAAITDTLNAVITHASPVNEKAIYIHYRIGTTETYVLQRHNQAIQIISGYDAASLKITLYILPNVRSAITVSDSVSHNINACSASLPCAKIEINPLSASAQITKHP